MVMAIMFSLTVSIAEEISGMFSAMVRVSLVAVSTAEGMISE